jgi:hypothetical protein
VGAGPAGSRFARRAPTTTKSYIGRATGLFDIGLLTRVAGYRRATRRFMPESATIPGGWTNRTPAGPAAASRVGPSDGAGASASTENHTIATGLGRGDNA